MDNESDHTNELARVVKVEVETDVCDKTECQEARKKNQKVYTQDKALVHSETVISINLDVLRLSFTLLRTKLTPISVTTDDKDSITDYPLEGMFQYVKAQATSCVSSIIIARTKTFIQFILQHKICSKRILRLHRGSK